MYGINLKFWMQPVMSWPAVNECHNAQMCLQSVNVMKLRYACSQKYVMIPSGDCSQCMPWCQDKSTDTYNVMTPMSAVSVCHDSKICLPSVYVMIPRYACHQCMSWCQDMPAINVCHDAKICLHSVYVMMSADTVCNDTQICLTSVYVMMPMSADSISWW